MPWSGFAGMNQPDFRRASEHRDPDEAKDDQEGEDGEDAFFETGERQGHGAQRGYSPSGCRPANSDRMNGWGATVSQLRLLETRMKSWSASWRKP